MKQIDPAKVEEAENPEESGPAMAKGSFEHDVDSDDDNLTAALAEARAGGDKKDDDKKEGEKKEGDQAAAQKP